MTTGSTASALELIGRHVSQAPLGASAQSLVYLRNALIDIYGCIIAGAGEAVARKTRQALIDCAQVNDRGEAPILGTGYRTTPGAAALANAVAGHALEFDDWELPGNTHISVLLFPAILAAACRRSLSGQDAIAAYLAGYETVARIGEAINLEHYQRGWHATATIGAIGVAAAVSRLLNLDSGQTANALAIATSRGLGYNAQFGSEAKPLQVGFAVEGGILAPNLAAAGLTGQAHMLEHGSGMGALMGPGDPGRIGAAIAKIGAVPAIDEYQIVFKPWPTCGYTHRIMTGMLELKAGTIEVADIENIELYLPDLHAAILPFEQPRNQAEAQFSLPYCAASALLTGGLTAADLENRTWLRPDISRLIERTTIRGFACRRPQLNYDPEQPDRVVIRAAGETLAVDVPYPLGAPQNPLSEARHRLKFQLNAGLDDRQLEQAWERLLRWPEADNLHRVFIPMPAGEPAC